MVQYILTPWRDRQELLRVRQQFYPEPPTSASASAVDSPSGVAQSNAADPDQQHQAVARVSMWMQRGNCPHLVESTALLAAAILNDGENSGNGAKSTYAVRAAYSAAFSRFVTGLLDSHQDSQRKLSMYSIAKTVGLPATFVELRHQATHEQLPSLVKLRSAARKALIWIWEYYWQHLASDAEATIQSDPCREVILSYLEADNAPKKEVLMKQLKPWDESIILGTLAAIVDAPPSNKALLGALRLSREIVQSEMSDATDGDGRAIKDVQQMRTELLRSHEELGVTDSGLDSEIVDAPATIAEDGSGTGWSTYDGVWKPKPIGIV